MRLSKTIAANVLIVLLAWWFQSSDFYVNPLWFVVGIAAVNIWLRLVTTQPTRGIWVEKDEWWRNI